MSDARDERIESYRASIDRLKRVNADLRAEQRRMKWVAIATVVLSALAYAASHTVGIFALLVGGSAFGVGHYVLFMHIHENKLTIRSARQTIAALHPNEGRAHSNVTIPE